MAQRDMYIEGLLSCTSKLPGGVLMYEGRIGMCGTEYVYIPPYFLLLSLNIQVISPPDIGAQVVHIISSISQRAKIHNIYLAS